MLDCRRLILREGGMEVFRACFADLVDPRRGNAQRHELDEIVMVPINAVSLLAKPTFGVDTLRRLLFFWVCGALLVLTSTTVSSAAAEATLRAFPTAEGYGAFAAGGRGGIIKQVTNLNDDGPGSLRDAVRGNTPCTVVFRVGGTITSKSRY